METVDVTSLTRWIREFAHSIEVQKDQLTNLDAAIGDGDHGVNMDRGFRAAVAAMNNYSPPNITVLFRDIVMQTITGIGGVGGAGGALYGAFFRGMAQAAEEAPSLEDVAFAAALRTGLTELVQLGMPKAGDKTMLDALAPALDALDLGLAERAGLGAALRRAAIAAGTGRDATVPMLARKGRAARLGRRSIGHQDPGATSAALLIAAAATVLKDATAEDTSR